MLKNSNWITPGNDMGGVCPEFVKNIKFDKKPLRAILYVTAIGVYEAHINGRRVGEFVLAPGCSAYEKRLQYQEYDVTDMLDDENEIGITVGTGWHRGRISVNCENINKMPCGVIAKLKAVYSDGAEDVFITDESWRVRKTKIQFSDIYDGEIYDANAECEKTYDVKILYDLPKERLIAQEGEIVCEHERIKPIKTVITPKGETVLDFGQNIAGYVEFTVNARQGDRIKLSCAEVLDRDGNFYNENYRSAKSSIEYICCDGVQTYKPHFTFMGFRYIRLDEYPSTVTANDFTAIALYSNMKRTGYIKCSDNRINRLFENVIWSQKDNFIDIPTDCPQRDERMGWLGDAQVFAKTGGYNFNVKRFFNKWLADLRVQQREDGSVPDTVPNFWRISRSSTAWGDAITIIPWTMYLLYGDKSVLEENLEAMKAWVDYITGDTLDKHLWTSRDDAKKLWGKHYGDWLGLDAPDGSYKGSSDEDFIASVFYAYSTQLVVKAGKVLGLDVTAYEELYKNITRTIKKRYTNFKTQTECVLALHFDLTDNKVGTAKQLADMIKQNQNRLQTGFVGTPYLLYALSDNGYTDLAYELLMQNRYPSWLYEVEHGATTIWEHWDGIKDDGSFWSKDMNSYNHYAYGSVVDWIYTVSGGIRTDEEKSGFENVIIAPKPTGKLDWLSVSLDTAYGMIHSKWEHFEGGIRYEIETPVPAKITIGNNTQLCGSGRYIFYSE